jgi:dTDP-4-dehydrorhamnose reductase
MKILILGKSGMLGHVVHTFFSKKKDYKVTAWSRKEMDATMTHNKIETLLNTESPDIIINCIGLINKYANRTEMKKNAKIINTDFPHLLAYLSIKNNYKLIHISTDCYQDKDTYGQSKYFGEINDKKNLTIRTSIIGPEIKQGFGLFHWFMNESRETSGYSQAKWDGVTTLQLAMFMEFCIKSEQCGLLDYRTNKSISKYNLLNIIAKTFEKNIHIKKDKRKMPDKRNRKPDFSCKKTYEKQIKELKNYMIKNKKTYQHYFT